LRLGAAFFAAFFFVVFFALAFSIIFLRAGAAFFFFPDFFFDFDLFAMIDLPIATNTETVRLPAEAGTAPRRRTSPALNPLPWTGASPNAADTPEA
jgi:hypothetical protein